MEETMVNIYEKLAAIRSMADVAAKTKKGFNYTYSDITEILANVTAGMKKYGISLIPSIEPGTSAVRTEEMVNTKVGRTGEVYEQKTTEVLVAADMKFIWVNDSNPEERIEVPWFLVGSQSDASQAFGSALTYSMRYFLTNYFEIAQVQAESDVDAYRSKQKEAAALEEKEAAAQIISKFDSEVREYLAKNPDESEPVADLVKKYRKDSNYFAIKDPKLAASLLKEFHEKFLEVA